MLHFQCANEHDCHFLTTDRLVRRKSIFAAAIYNACLNRCIHIGSIPCSRLHIGKGRVFICLEAEGPRQKCRKFSPADIAVRLILRICNSSYNLLRGQRFNRRRCPVRCRNIGERFIDLKRRIFTEMLNLCCQYISVQYSAYIFKGTVICQIVHTDQILVRVTCELE
ncbi:hypothetical protein D3C85_1274250 [compost metagenome]